MSVRGGLVEVEEIRLGGIVLRFLVDGTVSGSGVTMFEMTVAPGAGMPVPHHHVGFDETGYGVSGRLKFTLEGETLDVGRGTWCGLSVARCMGFRIRLTSPRWCFARSLRGFWGQSIFGRFVGCWVGVGRLILRRWAR